MGGGKWNLIVVNRSQIKNVYKKCSIYSVCLEFNMALAVVSQDALR